MVEIQTCPVCGEPTERVREVPEGALRQTFGEVFRIPRACACRRAEYARLDAERAERERAKELDTRKRNALMLDSYRSMTFDRDDGKDPTTLRIAKQYVAKADTMLERNMGLMMIGASGTGKTFVAGCIANALLDAGYTVLMTNVPTLEHELSADYGENREQTLRKIAKRQFLILDDLGFERDTSTAKERAFEIINARYESRKPLIVTTNLTREELVKTQTMANDRMYSRVREMATLVMDFGVPRRKAIQKDRRAEMLEVLGL